MAAPAHYLADQARQQAADYTDWKIRELERRFEARIKTLEERVTALESENASLKAGYTGYD